VKQDHKVKLLSEMRKLIPFPSKKDRSLEYLK